MEEVQSKFHNFVCPRCVAVTRLRKEESNCCRKCGFPEVAHGCKVVSVKSYPPEARCSFSGNQEATDTLMHKPIGYRLIRGFNLMRDKG